MTKEAAKKQAEKYLEWANIAEKRAREIESRFYAEHENFDWSEPIKLGHHSQRRHERVFERRDRTMRQIIELEEKAKSHRIKSANLIEFSQRNKGDAERRWQKIRDENDSKIGVGTKVYVVGYRTNGVVAKVLKRRYKVALEPDDYIITVDKVGVDLR